MTTKQAIQSKARLTVVCPSAKVCNVVVFGKLSGSEPFLTPRKVTKTAVKQAAKDVDVSLSNRHKREQRHALPERVPILAAGDSLLGSVSKISAAPFGNVTKCFF